MTPRRRIAGERRRPETHPLVEPAETEQAPPPRPPSEPLAPNPPEPPPAPRERKPGSWVAFAAALALTAVLVGAALWLGLRTWDYREVQAAQAAETAGEAASESAERAATALLSYKHDTLDADLKAGTRFLTPEYAKTFTETFDQFVRPNAPKLQAVVTAKVLASAVVTADEDRAQILVYVDQTSVTTANNGRPQLALNRTTFDMVKRDGTWLVDGFNSY